MFLTAKFGTDVECWRDSKENPSNICSCYLIYQLKKKKERLYPIFLCPPKTDLCPVTEEVDISGPFSSFSWGWSANVLSSSLLETVSSVDGERKNKIKSMFVQIKAAHVKQPAKIDFLFFNTKLKCTINHHTKTAGEGFGFSF